MAQGSKLRAVQEGETGKSHRAVDKGSERRREGLNPKP